MVPAPQPWRVGAGGLAMLARVTPRARREGVGGVTATAQGPAIEVRGRAVAENGKANAAVESVVAQWLGLARTRVSVAQGAKSRVKTIAIAGTPGELEALLAARLAGLA